VLALAPFIQFQLAINAVHAFVIPVVTLPFEHLKELAETKLGFSMRQTQERGNDLLVRSRRWRVAIDRAAEFGNLTSSTFTQAVFVAFCLNDLAPLVLPQCFFAMSYFLA
jgi:hypothetical protein